MTPEEIAAAVAAGACFRCLSGHDLMALNTYLLAVLAEGSLDPSVLIQAAACFKCLSEMELLQVQAYLLCQLNNA